MFNTRNKPMEKQGPLPICSVLEESPQVVRNKHYSQDRDGKINYINHSSELVLESKSMVSSQRNFEAEGHTRLVFMIEAKYLASKLRLYRYPGQEEEDEESILSLKSLKMVGKYDLRSQNKTRPVQEGQNLQQLDFTKLLKRRGRPLNSEREAMITRIDLQNICPTARHQKSGIFDGDKSSPTSQRPTKQFTNTFLKGFLKRINLKKDKDNKQHAVKKNFASNIKLKCPFVPPFKDKSLSIPKQKQDMSIQKRVIKQGRGEKDVSRRDLLLQYLKDCRVSLEKLKPKQPIDRSQKSNPLNVRLNSKNSQRDRGAFSSLALEKPIHLSKTQNSCCLDSKRSMERTLKSNNSTKNSKKKKGKLCQEATDSLVKLSRSFKKDRKGSKKAHRSTSRSNEHDFSNSRPIRPSNTLLKSKYSTKFTAITKLVINNQKAYLHFDDRPKSDRFF